MEEIDRKLSQSEKQDQMLQMVSTGIRPWKEERGLFAAGTESQEKGSDGGWEVNKGAACQEPSLSLEAFIQTG